MRMEEVERGREETPHQELSTNLLQAVDGEPMGKAIAALRKTQ